MQRRELLDVVARERVGPYTLLRVRRGGLEPGVPGQFFMLEAPGRVLPRPMSLCLAPPGELAFLIDVVGPGTRAIYETDALHVFGPLGNGFDLRVQRPLLVAGGIGVAPMPYVSAALASRSGAGKAGTSAPGRLRRAYAGAPRTMLGFRSAWHAEAAALLPHAEVVLEPTYVTEAMPGGYDVLACGPEPMLEAVRALAPDSQLAWEAPMACGFGACYGCVVDGKRLCVDGPVLRVAATQGLGTAA